MHLNHHQLIIISEYTQKLACVILSRENGSAHESMNSNKINAYRVLFGE